LHSLGRLLWRLHSTPVPEALKNPATWISRRLQEAEENLPWCDGTSELLDNLKLAQPFPIPEVLIHGDTALDNVLIDAAGRLSLIDWATADSGDYRCDIALALQSEPETTFTEEELHAFYAGYEGARVDRLTRKWFEDLWDFF